MSPSPSWMAFTQLFFIPTEKRCHSKGWVRIKAENGIWGKKTPALLHDVTKQHNADIKARTLMLGQSQEPSSFSETSQGQAMD